MIHQLYIRDFAVIDELSLEFGSGLNLLTGETGAGKSIIVDAIGIALGERADTEAVRSGSEKAVVEVVLEVTGSAEVIHILEEAGISPEDGCIMVSREVQKTGKSQCRINGRPSPVSLLKEITDQLVDTHGQHEHQFLLKPERHIDVLDSWCGEEVSLLKQDVRERYSELQQLRKELHELESDERERARMTDLYQFQAKEISDAKLTPGEEEELLSDRIRLASAEKLHASASAAFLQLGDRARDGSTLDTLGETVMALESIADLDPQIPPMLETLKAALYQVEDAARELRAYRDSVEFSPERLQIIEERLDLIRTLKRKYGDTIEEIIKFGSELDGKLESLVHSEERIVELSVAIERVESETMSSAEKLSELRQKGANIFAQAVEKELETLSMPDAKFQVDHERADLLASGIDRMEFLISANPGEPPKPLSKIASGGEMSRVMLAIKSVMAAADSMPTLVFDEIDVGIGGRTAEVIGRKLDLLAEKSQVLCITHLPQIACRNGEHFSIEKQVLDGRTAVRVRRLENEERVTELARMLGGTEPSETAVRHAKEMLGAA